MMFVVFRELGDYGFSYATDRLNEKLSSDEFDQAHRFATFNEANEFCKQFISGQVLAIDEPTLFDGLDDVASRIETLRSEILFNGDKEEWNGLSRYAEQHLLSALASLELAYRSAKLAWMENLDRR